MIVSQFHILTALTEYTVLTCGAIHFLSYLIFVWLYDVPLIHICYHYGILSWYCDICFLLNIFDIITLIVYSLQRANLVFLLLQDQCTHIPITLSAPLTCSAR